MARLEGMLEIFALRRAGSVDPNQNFKHDTYDLPGKGYERKASAMNFFIIMHKTIYLSLETVCSTKFVTDPPHRDTPPNSYIKNLIWLLVGLS